MNEWIHLPWQMITALSSLLLGAFLLILLFLNKYPSSRWLSLVIFASLVLLISGLFDLKQQSAWQLNTLLISGIAYWRYLVSFFTQKTRISGYPFLILLLTAPLSLANAMVSEFCLWGILPSFMVGTLLLSRRVLLVEGRSRGIQWFFNPGSRLIWVRNFTLFQFLLITFGFVVALHWLPIWVDTLLVLTQLCFVFFQLAHESTFLSPLPTGTKYQKSTLTAAQKASILTKLDVLIDKEQFYLSNDISLSSLAASLHTSTHHLSQVLNESRKQSFQELITQYRIREAKRLLKDQAHAHTKVESIAMMVGYNSKSAFNTAFKKQTAHTPSEFRASKNVLTDGDEPLPNRENTTSESYLIDLRHVLLLKTQSIMFSNFIKVFYRRAGRNKLFSLINLFGLTVGFTCSILIYLFIKEHTSYELELPSSEQIYRLAWINDNPQTRTPHPIAQQMQADLPEVVQSTTLSPIYGPGLTRDGVQVENKQAQIQFIEKDFFYVDSTFLDVFELEVLAGDPQALSKPWNIVLSKSTATRYFGKEDPIGQVITVDDWDIAVAAVVADMPERSHFHVTGLISYVTLKAINPDNLWFTWEDFGHFNYIKVAPGTNVEQLEERIPEWMVSYLPWSESTKEMLLNREAKFELQPIRDIHLHSHLRWELEDNANILYIYILTGALTFILLIICINYINLTTAKSIERAREVGVRKTLGALSTSLTAQFYMESLSFCLIASLLALGLAAVLLPFFNALTQLSFSLSSFFQADLLLVLGAVVLCISSLSGIYPALVMDQFKPVEVLKGRLSTSYHGRRLRNGLVIFQFFVSSILIMASLIILKQLNYMKTKELGFDQEALISIKMYPSAAIGGMDVEMIRTLENEFINIPGVQSASGVSNLPGGSFNQLSIYSTPSPEERIDASQLGIDYGGLVTMGITMAKGRPFDPLMDNDTLDNHFILNEAAIKRLQLDDPLGASITWEQAGKRGNGIIVGVTKDFHYQSLHSAIEPLIVYLDPYDVNHIVVKLEGQHFQKNLSKIEAAYREVNPSENFEYTFLDQQLSQLYQAEVRTLNIFIVFTSIALFLACIGLAGLAIALLHQHIKDIGIRKIMGARSRDIFGLVLSQFLKLIGIALLFGLPIGYVLIKFWLQEFSYQTTIGAMPFIVAGISLLFIAALSVSAIILKIAHTNPADTLRYE